MGRGLRTSDEEYERVYEGFMRALLAVVEPYLYVNGGPIVMTQVLIYIVLCIIIVILQKIPFLFFMSSHQN